MSDLESDRRLVPGWAVKLIADVAETRESVRNMAPEVTEVRRKIEGFVTRAEYESRHSELAKQIEKLSRESQQRQGAVRVWRYIYGAALAVLSSGVVALWLKH